MNIILCAFPENIRNFLPDVIEHIERFYPNVNVGSSDEGIRLSSDVLPDEVLRRIALAAGSNILLTHQAHSGRTQVLEMLLL